MENGPSEHKAIWLRKLRRGVTLRFDSYDNEGIPHWQIYDEGRNKFFVVGWPEYEMLSRWDLKVPKAIVDAVNKETTLHIDLQDFENLLNFLNRNYLLEQRWRNVYQMGKEQKLIKGENLFYWFLRYYLFFRVPLFHPDEFLNRTKWFGNFIFNPMTTFVMFILGIIASYQIGLHWEEFTHTFAKVFTWQGLFFYFIAFSVAKFFHEFGHAYMSKQYGVSVPTMGVAFLVFWPVLYTDTTQSWSLPSHQRIRIAMAGMWVETYITIFAALIWVNVHNVTLQMICYVTVAINWVSTLLINTSPFMRFDGYYVFSDFLNVPNLQNRAFALARWQIRNWLFGWEENLPEFFPKRMHWLLVSYALVTWTYRLVIYFGIAVLVYHYFFKAIGIVLFLIELFVFILRPFVLEFQTWYTLRSQFTLNRRLVITILCAVTILFLLLMPLSQGIKMNATLSYKHEFMLAKQDAVIDSKLPQQGTHVKANQVLVELKSPSLEQELKNALLEYDKTSAELRRASLDPNYSNQSKNLETELSEKKTNVDKLLKQKSQLNIIAPFNGVVSDVDQNLIPGTAIMKNSWILSLVKSGNVVIEAYVEQSNFQDVQLGDTGVFYPMNISDPSVPVKVIGIEPINTPNLSWRYSKQLNENMKESLEVATPGYNASELGGKIPTNLTDKGEYVPVESVFRILLSPEQSIKIDHIELGTVVLNSNTRNSFSNRLFYKMKRTFVQESGF